MMEEFGSEKKYLDGIIEAFENKPSRKSSSAWTSC